MKEIGIDELKRIQLEILSAVHDFCVDNRINYSLTAGTLLGAIRHQGYIPWDDDIDICMPRPDYERFIKSFNGYKRDLSVLSPELDWGFYAPYANVCDNRTIVKEGANGHRGKEMGIKIDIFPVDGLPLDYEEFLIKQKRIAEINDILRAKRYILYKMHLKDYLMIAKYAKKRISTCLKSYQSYQKELNYIATSSDFNNSPYANSWVFSIVKERLDKQIFVNYIEVLFEGKYFKAVEEYDKYLKVLYGDYMELPPLEKRTPHHDFKSFWK